MLKYDFKLVFFDRKAVTDALDKASRKALGHIGAVVRKTARWSIRKRKGVSKPGAPPSSHAGQLRSLLFFGYDAQSQSVVIGPTPFKQGTAPSLLEYGGTTVADEKLRFPIEGVTKNGQQKYKTVKRGERMTYDRRPFMGPALEANESKFPDMWKDSIRVN